MATKPTLRLRLEQTPKATVHESTMGTYHEAPNEEVAWTINDTRGYIDGGPSCDDCGACGCESHNDDNEESVCVGLSFAFICLDGGEALCGDCAEGVVEIVPCSCG